MALLSSAQLPEPAVRGGAGNTPERATQSLLLGSWPSLSGFPNAHLVEHWLGGMLMRVTRKSCSNVWEMLW